jgi:hypothetical protein
VVLDAAESAPTLSRDILARSVSSVSSIFLTTLCAGLLCDRARLPLAMRQRWGKKCHHVGNRCGIAG